MSCNNYSESQLCCTDNTLGIVITSDFHFSSGYSLFIDCGIVLLHQMSTCSGLMALNNINFKFSKGHTMTGVGVGMCARHNFI